MTVSAERLWTTGKVKVDCPGEGAECLARKHALDTISSKTPAESLKLDCETVFTKLHSKINMSRHNRQLIASDSGTRQSVWDVISVILGKNGGEACTGADGERNECMKEWKQTS